MSSAGVLVTEDGGATWRPYGTLRAKNTWLIEVRILFIHLILPQALMKSHWWGLPYMARKSDFVRRLGRTKRLTPPNFKP